MCSSDLSYSVICVYIYVWCVPNKSIKEFRNSSWYQSQFSETLIPSGRLLFRPSFIPAKPLWPSLNPAISQSGHHSFQPSLSGHLSFRPSVPILRPVSLVFSSSLFPATIFGCLPHLHEKIRNGIITSIQRHSTRIRGHI